MLAESDTPYQRLKQLGIVLPAPPQPIGNFVAHCLEGGLLFLSGQGPVHSDGTIQTGKVGDDTSIEEARADARLTGINLISVMHVALGDLRRVRRIVKVLGMVNAVPSFKSHPSVIDGCSDLLVDVFGERGSHARSAVGFSSLPNNITVEIECVVAVD